MTKSSIEKFRKRLLAEQTRLEEDRARLHEASGEGMSQRIGEGSDFDTNHPGDMGTEMFEWEKEQALNANLDDMLSQVHSALTKMDAGSYGLCDRCGQPIAEARLTALPYATLCITCQSRLETE